MILIEMPNSHKKDIDMSNLNVSKIKITDACYLTNYLANEISVVRLELGHQI